MKLTCNWNNLVGEFTIIEVLGDKLSDWDKIEITVDGRLHVFLHDLKIVELTLSEKACKKTNHRWEYPNYFGVLTVLECQQDILLTHTFVFYRGILIKQFTEFYNKKLS